MQRTSWTKPNQINETKIINVEMRLVILTDGMENASRIHTLYHQIATILRNRKMDSFLSLGADIDSAYTSSKMLNIRSENVISLIKKI
jgi:DNA polymerase II large subunit